MPTSTIIVLLFTLTGAAAAAQAPFCDQLRALTQDPTVGAAHWGIQVTDLKGDPLCSINEAQLFRPASNNKIFTTATALALLGPAHTFTTKVTGKLDPATGTITGDLTLVGGGDANLDSNDLPYVPPAQRTKIPTHTTPFPNLEELAAQLIAKGVKSVTGDIVGDDTLFPYEPYPPSWNADDFVWGYGAPVSALTIADNQLRLTITPGTITGEPGRQSFPAATITLEQSGVPYYTVVNQVGTIPAKRPGGIQIERLPGTRTLRVYGQIAEDAPPDTEEVAIDDPAAFAALAFRQILAAHGISITGVAHAKHAPSLDPFGFLVGLNAPNGSENLTLAGGAAGNCIVPLRDPTLATHTSGPLLDDITLTDKISQNLHAELLLHHLGRRVFCGSGSNVAGARMVRAYLLRAGLDPSDFLLYDGSGLSDHDLVTPRVLAKFLAYAATQPWFPQWKSALPIGGVDGSLLTRFGPPNSTLKGRVFAKTGTLGESRALSGYLTTASDKTLIFSILVDTHLPGNADRTIMDRIVETIAAQN